MAPYQYHHLFVNFSKYKCHPMKKTTTCDWITTLDPLTAFNSLSIRIQVFFVNLYLNIDFCWKLSCLTNSTAVLFELLLLLEKACYKKRIREYLRTRVWAYHQPWSLFFLVMTPVEYDLAKLINGLKYSKNLKLILLLSYRLR